MTDAAEQRKSTFSIRMHRTTSTCTQRECTVSRIARRSIPFRLPALSTTEAGNLFKTSHTHTHTLSAALKWCISKLVVHSATLNQSYWNSILGKFSKVFYGFNALPGSSMNKWKQMTQPNLMGVAWQLNSKKQETKLNKLSLQHEMGFFFCFQKICGMWQCFPQGHKSTREHNKSLCSPLSANDIEPGKWFQPEGCQGTRVWQRKEVCVFRMNKGLVPDLFQTQRHTLQYECSRRLLTFTLLVLQDQNNKAARRTRNLASSVPKMTSSWKKKWNRWVDNKQGAMRNHSCLKQPYQWHNVHTCQTSNDCVTCKRCVSSQMYNRRWSPLKTNPVTAQQEPFLHRRSATQRSLSAVRLLNNSQVPNHLNGLQMRECLRVPVSLSIAGKGVLWTWDSGVSNKQLLPRHTECKHSLTELLQKDI